jgi:two-component system response regulator NreC
MPTQLKNDAVPAAREGSVAGATPDGLTERELEVLRMIALGHTNAEIAEQCALSLRTIETHRARIVHKTGRTTRAHLVRYALEHRLLGL